MGAYILRRLLLIVPTLFGILLINFLLVQFMPGGPIEQVIAELESQTSATDRITGGGAEAGGGGGSSEYRGAQGLPPEFIAELERQFGFDKPAWQRFLIMLGNYLTFDFGESYFRSISVVDLVLEKMPVSITLGLWSTLLAYLISIPLGIAKAVRDGTRFDTATSGAIIVAYAIPSFLFAVMLLVLFAGGSYWRIFPLRGLPHGADRHGQDATGWDARRRGSGHESAGPGCRVAGRGVSLSVGGGAVFPLGQMCVGLPAFAESGDQRGTP